MPLDQESVGTAVGKGVIYEGFKDDTQSVIRVIPSSSLIFFFSGFRYRRSFNERLVGGRRSLTVEYLML